MTRLIAAMVALIPAMGWAQTTPTEPPKPTMEKPKWPTEVGGESLDDWIKKLKDSDPSVRDMAIRVIPMFGDPAKKAIPTLISMMVNDNDTTVKVSALLTMTSVDVTEPEHVKKIVTNVQTMLKHSQGAIRIQAAAAAARIGPSARITIGQLADYLIRDQSSFEVRKAGAHALGYVGRDEQNWPDHRALLALLGAISDPALAVRVEALQSLIILGKPSSEDDTEAMRKSINARLNQKSAKYESDKVMQLFLRVCLMRLDEKQVTEANLSPISSALRDPKLRMSAARALELLGKDARSKVPNLIEGLQSDKPEDLPFVAVCLSALAAMGTDAKPAEAAVMKLTSHTNEGIKMIAKEALERIQGIKK